MTIPTPTSPPRRPPIRWWWIGLALSAIIWLVSGIYRQQIQPFDEIAYLSDSLTAQEISERNQKKDDTHRHFQYLSLAIAAGALAHLSYSLVQTLQRRKQRNSSNSGENL